MIKHAVPAAASKMPPYAVINSQVVAGTSDQRPED